VPADIPDTMPDDTPTEATVAFDELHVPPVVALLSVELLPSQSVVTPVIGGSAAKDRKVENSSAVSSVRFFISIYLFCSYYPCEIFSPKD